MFSDNGRIQQTDKKIDANILDTKLLNILFLRLVAKDKLFTRVDFRYTIFDSSYLRNCKFDSCDFTGCRFIASNLHGSVFSGCRFDYCLFERTLIDSDILDTECPAHENLKRIFARTLRMNYQQIGDASAVNKAIKVELEASKMHKWKAWKSNESYYRKKYVGNKRLKAFADWLSFKFLDFLWGNGEEVLNLIRSIAICLGLIALVDVLWFRDASLVASYANALADAPKVFLGTLTPAGHGANLISVIVFARLISVGLLLSILLKRLNRR